MKISNVMVSVDLGAAAADRVQLAAGLAERFEARLIGVAARPVLAPMPVGDMLEVERVWAIEERLPADHHDVGGPGPMGVAAGALLMEVGRPVLVAPPGIERLAAKRVVVAWKDTREARRAVHDALPFLTRADEVLVAVVGPDADREGAEDVAAYLSDHSVAVTTHLLRSPEVSAADEILRFAGREEADLVVMGAYGHSRLREWIFGGATRDVLQTTPVCCLMSH